MRSLPGAPHQRLATWLVAAFAAGVVAGLLAGPHAEVLRPLADVFIWLLRLVALPIVAASMLMAAATLVPAELGRLGVLATGLYVVASAVATALGAIAATVLPVPATPDLVPEAATTVPAWTTIAAQWLPSGVALSVDLLILPVLIVSALTGLAIGAGASRAGEGPPRVVAWLSAAVRVLLWPVWWYAPVGVFALTALVFARPGVVAGPLATAFVAVYLAQAVVAVALVGVLRAAGIPAWRFVADVRDVLVTALATGSSAAVLPLELRVASERAGITPATAAFTVPLGVSISKVGTAAYLGALAVWAAQLSGTPLPPAALAQLVAVAIAAAVATPPISGGGLIMLGLVFQQAGVPLGLIGLIGGLPLLGKGNTPLNALGRLVCARLIDTLRPRAVVRSAPATS
jgi:Na+/H+-dicarboxylate symporter